MTNLTPPRDAVDAHKLELTNPELESLYGIRREWVRECPGCGVSHPVTLFPVQTTNELLYVAECRRSGLMTVDLEPGEVPS